MRLELGVSDAQVKARVLDLLAAHGFQVESGPVRLAHPFAIVVDGVSQQEEPAVLRLVAGVDPRAGRVTV